MKGTKGTRVLAAAVVAAALAVAGIGAAPAAASEPVSTTDWIKIMELKQKAVDIQSKGAVLLDEASTEEGRQALRQCISQAKQIYDICEDMLRGE